MCKILDDPNFNDVVDRYTCSNACPCPFLSSQSMNYTRTEEKLREHKRSHYRYMSEEEKSEWK